MLLLILDSLGGTELLVILVVALVIFGPRKLPQLSRSLGRSLADFKRTSQEFKETWEKEARLADDLKEARIERAMLPPEESLTTGATIGRGSPFQASAAAAENSATDATAAHAPAPAADVISASLLPPPSVRQVSPEQVHAPDGLPVAAAEASSPTETTRKQDWL